MHREQGSQGLRALIALAGLERDRALGAWRKAGSLEDLVRFQSRFNSMQEIIDMVLKKPVEFKQQQ